ncbi:MAG: divalent-cation tolerance protein CutA [Xanthomonadaceae bacterium]|nr:divalent-cation tolerance protein CutA [Xanthomonadaceae bacterium]MDE1961462.1 divalent-cation tolerance protein CutA [Xanthomonadaceae bacterium]MDE2083780.1 divalent-cation tolerance protein CutA [Xanthomonadaceae bacterium]
MNAVVIFCTCPDEASAARIAEALVSEHLAACVNRMSGIASTYRWEGAIHTDGEVLLLIKSVRERFEALRARIVALHPYELPEVIAVDIALGHAPYLDWIARETVPDAR